MNISVEYIDHMGNDNSIVNAARVSFNKSADNYTQERNEKLIKYLATHKHEIPFAHTAITLRVKAPISIRTQCFKHKVGFVENEISRRYVANTPEVFIPEFREKPEENVKQGSGDIHRHNEIYKKYYKAQVNTCLDLYELMIKNGIAPEQARFILPQGVMTEWIWTGSLLAFARFYNLRNEPTAQKEVQDLAKLVGSIIEPLYPVSWKALTEK